MNKLRSFYLHVVTHVKSLKGTLKSIHEEKTDLVLENRKLYRNQKGFENSLEAKDLTIHEVSNKLSNKCVEMEELSQNITDLQEKNNVITSELKEKNGMISEMDTKMKNTIESVNEGNNCSMSLSSGDKLMSSESHDVSYYTNRCQDLTKKLKDSQAKLIQGQMVLDTLNDDIYELNERNFCLMNDNSKLKKEVNMKGFLHTPAGSVLPSQTLSSVTAESYYSKEKDVRNKVDESSSRIVLQMTEIADVSPESIAMVTQESELSNKIIGGTGSNADKGEHDGMTKDLTNPGIVGVGSNEKRRT